MGLFMTRENTFIFLDKLWKTILERANSSAPEDSYVAYLLEKGPEECAKKLGEEGIETVIASIQKNNGKALVHESADLIFHLLVLLKATNTDPYLVIKELKKREKLSGHEEKRTRKKSES